MTNKTLTEDADLYYYATFELISRVRSECTRYLNTDNRVYLESAVNELAARFAKERTQPTEL